MTLVAVFSLVESTGVYFALGEITKKKLDGHDLKRGNGAEGLAIILVGLVNAFPFTPFSKNVGFIQFSAVRKLKIIYIAGIMLVILGLVPKIGAATLAIPGPVIGGAMIAMFGTVISAGIKMLSHIDLQRQENMLIVAISVGMGLGVTVVPDI